MAARHRQRHGLGLGAVGRQRRRGFQDRAPAEDVAAGVLPHRRRIAHPGRVAPALYLVERGRRRHVLAVASGARELLLAHVVLALEGFV